jgi:hypothetical protein
VSTARHLRHLLRTARYALAALHAVGFAMTFN